MTRLFSATSMRIGRVDLAIYMPTYIHTEEGPGGTVVTRPTWSNEPDEETGMPDGARTALALVLVVCGPGRERPCWPQLSRFEGAPFRGRPWLGRATHGKRPDRTRPRPVREGALALRPRDPAS